MLRASVPRAREREHPRPGHLKVEAPERRRAEVEVAVGEQRLHPQLEPKT